MSSSISRLAIKAMFWRVLLVITLSSVGGYWYNYQLVRTRTIHDIERYVHERIERESILFSIAEKNLKLMARNFQDLSKESHSDIEKRFAQLMRKRPDGTFRSLHRDPEKIQVLVPRHAKLNFQMKKNIVLTESLMAKFGPVLSPHFLNVWMVGKENYGICYWPSEPGLLLDVPADFSFLEHEYATVGLPKNNPSGKPNWAGPYLDTMSHDWMISLNQPVYLGKDYQLSFGMDIILEEFNQRSTTNLMQGTYNIIFNKDGRLIVHPNHMKKIMESNGQFFIEQSKDPELISIYHQTVENRGRVIYDEKTKLFLGIGQIPNMDWFFVLVYPESNLKSIAGKTAFFVALMGLLSLIIEMLMLYQVLRAHVTRPIGRLAEAANRIAQGNFKSRVEISNEDEVGQLAHSFNEMAKNIEERDHLLLEHAAKLEGEVVDRTTELDLQRAKSVEAAKMATLGEISAGIAHEINNPLQIFTLALISLQKQLKSENLNREKLENYSLQMEKSIGRITKIIRGLKSFSRNSEGDEPRPTPFKTIIENTLVLCQQNLILRGITLHASAVPEVQVMCRESDIVQTLVNLIHNSIDVLENQEQKEISLLYEVADGILYTMVEDNGPGIPDHLAEKIMNPFFTTKEVGKGTGLGLFISSGLIHANGGRLYLDRSSKKTRFVFTLKISSVTEES